MKGSQKDPQTLIKLHRLLLTKSFVRGSKKRKVRIKITTLTFYQSLDKTRRYETFLGCFKNTLSSRHLIQILKRQVFLEHENCLTLLILSGFYLYLCYWSSLSFDLKLIKYISFDSSKYPINEPENLFEVVVPLKHGDFFPFHSRWIFRVVELQLQYRVSYNAKKIY